VDFGEVLDADTLEIVCFEAKEVTPEVQIQTYTQTGTYSEDLAYWSETGHIVKTVLEENFTSPVVRSSTHDVYSLEGKLIKAVYPLGQKKIRYFRLPFPMDRIYAIRLWKEGEEIILNNPHVNNLQAMYGIKTVCACQSAKIILPVVKDGDYIAAAIEGEHGEEGVYCVALIDHEWIAFPERATAYRANVWEFRVMPKSSNYTYYLPLTANMSGKEITVYTMLCNPDKTDICCDLYLCPKH